MNPQNRPLTRSLFTCLVALATAAACGPQARGGDAPAGGGGDVEPGAGPDDGPQEPEAPADSDGPQTPEAPEEPDAPEEPEEPQEPEGPEEPEAPEEPVIPEFGNGDGDIFPVATRRDGLVMPRDLDFHPDRVGELWAVDQITESVLIIFDALDGGRDREARADVGRGHFMAAVSSIAFGDNNMFATCHEDRNDVDPRAPDFMGPTLWSADLEIFAEVGQRGEEGRNGSHMDMLHQSPLCMGIAHHEGNAYWVFNGRDGVVDYYDFVVDHGPGMHDHSDGIVRRYSEVEVTRVPAVPGHLDVDDDTGWVYVADTGGGRVLRFDSASGRVVERLQPTNERLAEFSRMGDVDVEVFAEGLREPSGVAVGPERVFVGDHATGEIVAFDKEGEELGRLDTRAGRLMGITLGPEGRLWYVNGDPPTIIRVESDLVGEEPTAEE